MDIIQRNFYRLIRSGAFQDEEQLEPMSVFKWAKLYQLAVIHDVALTVYQGLLNSSSQFYLHLTGHQWEQWQQTTKDGRNDKNVEEDKLLKADHLTNPLLNRQLQDIIDDEDSNTDTRQLLLTIIRTARHILNEGVPLRQLVEMGTLLRQHHDQIDFLKLAQWLKKLRATQIAHLEGTLLILVMGFSAEEIPFLQDQPDKRAEQVAQELTEFTSTHIRDFGFSQSGDSIFVHTSNSSAIVGHIRRSARYFRYFPSETVTNFFASFAHSLSQIEE